MEGIPKHGPGIDLHTASISQESVLLDPDTQPDLTGSQIRKPRFPHKLPVRQQVSHLIPAKDIQEPLNQFNAFSRIGSYPAWAETATALERLFLYRLSQG
jgi:hypothetical protein